MTSQHQIIIKVTINDEVDVALHVNQSPARKQPCQYARLIYDNPNVSHKKWTVYNNPRISLVVQCRMPWLLSPILHTLV